MQIHPPKIPGIRHCRAWGPWHSSLGSNTHAEGPEEWGAIGRCGSCAPGSRGLVSGGSLAEADTSWGWPTSHLVRARSDARAQHHSTQRSPSPASGVGNRSAESRGRGGTGPDRTGWTGLNRLRRRMSGRCGGGPASGLWGGRRGQAAGKKGKAGSPSPL